MTDAEFLLYPTSFTQWWAFKKKTIQLWGKHFVLIILQFKREVPDQKPMTEMF